MEPEGGEERRVMGRSGRRTNRTVGDWDEGVMEMKELRMLPGG